jgi:hypothetical protein
VVLAGVVPEALVGATRRWPDERYGQPLLYVITAVGALVSAITLDWIIGLAGASSLSGGAIIGLYCGLGFVAPAILSDHLFNERPPMLYLIVAGFPIVGLLIMGAIIGALGA